MNNFEKYRKVKSNLLYGNLEENRELVFSVVIPTYNRKKLLQETLESVLNQKTNLNYEVVIVDNNSDFKDLEVLKIIEAYDNNKIFYYKNSENIGSTGNWNRCIELAKSEWIIMIHDDDIMLENALEEINKIKTKYNADLIHFQYITKDFIKNKIEDNIKGKKDVERIILERFLCDPQVLAPVCTAFKKSCSLEIGGFNDEYLPSIDYEFWIRYISKFKGLHIKNNPIAIYRIEDNDSLKKSVIIGGILNDYKIIEKLRDNYKIQYRLSKYNLLWRLYKNKKINKNEKKEIMKKLGYSKNDLVIAFLLRKLKIIKLWNHYQKRKLKIWR